MNDNTADLKALFDAFNRHDVDAVMSFMTDDVVFETAGGEDVHGTRIVGSDAVRDAFAGVWQTLPDAHWQTTGHTVVGELGVSEWIFRGTGADGARIEVEGCDLFTVRDGKIAMKRAFRKQRPRSPPDHTTPKRPLVVAFRDNGDVRQFQAQTLAEGQLRSALRPHRRCRPRP